jgi:drug/metabolite transporter (DMT)-like permease
MMKARLEILSPDDRVPADPSAGQEDPARIARGRAHWLPRLDAERSPRVGVALMLASCALLAAGDATAKWLSATFPVGQVICLRGVIILVLLTAICGPQAITALRPRHPVGQMWRALFFVAATFLMIWSFKLLPLPTVSAISFTAPIIMTALAPVMLRETVGWRRWLAVVAGFIGVLVIVAPQDGRWDWIVLLPVGAALCGAMRDLLTRQIADKESTISVVFVAVAATVVVGALTLAQGWVTPGPTDLMLFVLLGVIHGTAFLMQVVAFRAAEAGLLAPFKYTLLIWSIIAGFLVWGHVPTLAMLAGAAIVIASGVYVWRREPKVIGPTG